MTVGLCRSCGVLTFRGPSVGSAVVVHAADSSAVDWWAKYAAPWIDGSDEADCPHEIPRSMTVEGVVEQPRWHERSAGREEAGYFYGTEAVRRSRVDVTDVFTPGRSIVYTYDKPSRTIRVIGPDPVAVAFSSLRLGADVLRVDFESAGWVLLHAACVASKGEALLILGPNGAGKTTTALTVAAWAGWQLVANDRCFLTATESGVRATTLPYQIRVGRGYLRALVSPSKCEVRMDEAGVAPLADPKETFLVSELHALIPLEIAKQARLRAVLWPAMAATPYRLTSLEPLAREQVVSDGCPNFLGIPTAPKAVIRASQAQLLASLTRLPTGQVSLGHDLEANNHCLRRAVHALWS